MSFIPELLAGPLGVGTILVASRYKASRTKERDGGGIDPLSQRMLQEEASISRQATVAATEEANAFRRKNNWPELPMSPAIVDQYSARVGIMMAQEEQERQTRRGSNPRT